MKPPSGLELSIAKDILERAVRLVRAGWCRHYPALDDEDVPCDPLAMNAKRFDILGAVERASWDGRCGRESIVERTGRWVAIRALQSAVLPRGHGPATTWNVKVCRDGEDAAAMIGKALRSVDEDLARLRSAGTV